MVFEGELFHLGALSDEARWGILKLYRSWDLEQPAAWIMISEAALLFFRLRSAYDSPDYFPKGKWATIQYLGTLIDEYYKQNGKG